MVTGRLIELDNKFFVLLSGENVAQLGVSVGDEVAINKLDQLVAAANALQSQQEASEALKIARRVIAENREALRELAT